MEPNTIVRNYDINRKTAVDLTTVVHVNDSNTRTLELALYEGETTLPVSSESTVTADFVNRKTKFLLRSGTECDVNESGHICIPIDGFHTAGRQDVNVEVTITDENNEKTLTLPYPIWIRLNPSILEEAEEGEDSEGIIPDLLREAKEALDNHHINITEEDKAEIAGMVTVPTKTSDLINDSGFLTSHQDISGKADKVANGADGDIITAQGTGNIKRSGYKITNNKNVILNATTNSAFLPTVYAVREAIGQSAPQNTAVTFAQDNAGVRAFLKNASYSASDYTVSVIENYITNTYGSNLDRPLSTTLTVPTGATQIRLTDMITGGSYTNAASGGTFTLKNIIPHHPCFFEFLDADGAIISTGTVIGSGTARMIDAGGNTFNIRDIGGWACDGGTLAYGKLFRGCELNGDNYNVELSNAQKELFLNVLNIRDEIDLRGNSEVDGDDETYGTDDDITASALGDMADYVRYPIAAYASGINTASAVQSAYYAALIRRVISDLQNGKPCYIHCMAGADRTGTVCALIEALCGVSQTDIDKDFEMTSFATATNNLRKRNGSSWTGFITAMNAFEGESFRDKAISYALAIGITVEEINALRRGLINGVPNEIIIEEEEETTRIPAEYQEVEWIGSSGTQTIQVAFDSSFVGAYLETDIMRTNSGVRGLIGAANTDSVDIGAASGSYFGWNTNGIYEMGGSSISSVTSSTSDFDHVKFEWTATGSGKLTVNGTVATSRSGSSAYSKWNVFGGTSYPVSCKMKEVSIYNVAGGGIKTAHLIPCYRKSDNVIGMYDVVNSRFYTNIGTGSFTKGSDVQQE